MIYSSFLSPLNISGTIKVVMSCSGYVPEGNKAGYRATPAAGGWAGAIFEVTRFFGQEQGQEQSKTRPTPHSQVRFD